MPEIMELDQEFECEENLFATDAEAIVHFTEMAKNMAKKLPSFRNQHAPYMVQAVDGERGWRIRALIRIYRIDDPDY
jgi:hypothetical protein